jgi:hypothetical protein
MAWRSAKEETRTVEITINADELKELVARLEEVGEALNKALDEAKPVIRALNAASDKLIRAKQMTFRRPS